MKKFIIFTPSYNERSGGIVVLHKLCHLLNELGYDAKIYPYYERFTFDKTNLFKALWQHSKIELKNLFTGFKVNAKFNTPVIKPRSNFNVDRDTVVIYPEIVLGNPLNAKNVVRWLLHQPGFHTGEVMYSPGELLFKFNSAIDDFEYPGSKTSTHELKVIHYPLEHYNLENVADNRQGITYCLRKGKDKPKVRDHSNDTLIDHLSHKEVAKAFKSSKQFISYDTYTAYSIFAVLCGCESIVIPDEGVNENEWYPNDTDRYGISYGLSNVDSAKETAHLVLEHIKNEELKSIANVKTCLRDIEQFFFEKQK